MATYYVSKQRGNDTNNGTSPAAPWATVTKAVQTLVAGDTCYIGPATYREKPVNANAGTSGNIIQFIGDPDIEHVIGDTKGIVRVTGCDADEIEDASNDPVWNCQKNYTTLRNMLVDGGQRGVLFGVSSSLVERRADGMVFIGRFSGCQYGEMSNCLYIGGRGGMYYGTVINSVSIGGRYGFLQTNAVNCVGVGGQYGFYSCSSVNCMAVGSQYGFGDGSISSHINSIAMGCNTGFYGNSSKGNNCLAICCSSPASTINSSNYTNCRYTLCDSINSLLTQGPAILWTLSNLHKIIDAFEPWMFEGAKQWGDVNADASDTDILGRARRMLSGGLDIGPYAFSDYAPDFAIFKIAGPSICIKQKGMKIMEVPAAGGEQITVKVQVKHTGTSGNKPQILLRGDTIQEQSATCTAGNNTWQELSVSATPQKDEILTLVLYARDTNATAESFFSDITVS